MKHFCMLLIFFLISGFVQSQIIKTVIYDFDGFDKGATSLPEGDYSYGDLSYEASVLPIASTANFGDRCLKMNIHWSAGYAAFGRGVSRYVELDAKSDQLNFFFYNPSSNQQNAEIDVTLGDDDDVDYAYDATKDDTWKKHVSIAPSAGWQLISIPLKDFTDANTAGNGVFDIGFSNNQGMLLITEFRFSPPSNATDATYYLDMVNFSEGGFPHGQTDLDLPSGSAGDHCYLGAHINMPPGQIQNIPPTFEQMFPSGSNKHIHYVNTYIAWGSGTTADGMPGSGLQLLNNQGYVPIVTWEPMLLGYPVLDSHQPTLAQINAGVYDNYIDTFAAAIKTVQGTVIVRPMHEYDGDWYPWSISANGQDPSLFVSAYQHIVTRFRNAGVSNVQWMWCPNSDNAPYRVWNWIVNSYPGDNFVDIVATDVYNAHYPANLPWWRSFRWMTTETYYYMTKYFPTKPYFICELASRERTTAEDAESQTKAQWIQNMDTMLKSSFGKTRAIVFFDENKDQDWRVNSSNAALQSLVQNVWMDDYYFPATGTGIPNLSNSLSSWGVFPNPVAAGSPVQVTANSDAHYDLLDASGRIIRGNQHIEEGRVDTRGLDPGIYLVRLRTTGFPPIRLIVE